MVYASQTINGCESLDTLAVNIQITIITDPEINLPNNTICLESFATLDSLGIESLGYEVNYYDSSGNILNPDHIIQQNEYYYISYLDPISGCESNDVYIDIEVISCEVEIYNAISINNNYQNDYMVIENVELFPENQLQIFNRNGQLIYSQRNYGQDESKRFYGKSNTGTSLGTNSYLPSGSYIYIFTYLNEFTNQTKTRKGFVTIHNIIGQ